ncbi:hypothetical protein ACFPPF_04810 [Xenophilus aerolatus]|nr:hypothetical protein [Xenophilus aerolatus]
METDLGDYELLLDLQRTLIRLICATERQVVGLKQQRAVLKASRRSGHHGKAESAVIKAQATQVSIDLGTAQHMLFIWRCFGDGIAFLYINKYALKHMLYDSADYSVKQHAGALHGKDGFRLEWRILREVLQRGVPAVLCDITNTLRHGDVCVLVGPDPYPIEVKSSANRNARVDRQLDGLTKLHDFLATDEAVNFRGLKHVKRVEAPVSTVSHRAAMNSCIEQAWNAGFAQASPEEGLTYFCIRDPELADKLDFGPGVRKLLMLLNEPKTECAWMPYFPFTLSIRSAEALYEFISGKIVLAVLLDATTLVRLFADRGFDAQFVDDPHWEIVVRRHGADPAAAPMSVISKQLFARIFLEFESLSWLPEREAWFIDHLEQEGHAQDERIARDEVRPEDLMTGPVPTFRPRKWPMPPLYSGQQSDQQPSRDVPRP